MGLACLSALISLCSMHVTNQLEYKIEVSGMWRRVLWWECNNTSAKRLLGPHILTEFQLNRHFTVNEILYDWGVLFRLPVVAANFCISENFHTGSGALTAYCLRGTGISSREWSDRDSNLTTHLHLVFRLSLYPPPPMPLWHAEVQLLHTGYY